MVGRLSTIETIADPETMLGRRLPISATNGFRAIRKGYLRRARPGGRPLALAVTVYCLESSSRRLARRRRIMPAVPASPMTTIGTIMWLAKEPIFAIDHGRLAYSGLTIPPTEIPNQRLR